MISQETHTTLSSALGTTGPGMAAFVGGGGKSTALHRLAAEQAAHGARVVATTTTAMDAHELERCGPLVLSVDGESPSRAQVEDALGRDHVVTLARTMDADGKAGGLSPVVVDALWRDGLADVILVEADAGRGLSLKAFAEAEPQLPQECTTVVVVAGLDVLGRPFDESSVFRADLLAPSLGVAIGDEVTPRALSAVVGLLVERVRMSAPRARVVVFLNKADTDDRAVLGANAGVQLMTPAPRGGCRRDTSGRPDRIVVGSLWRGDYRVVYE